mmetsp:Transcript_79077/g.223796  ORF Transcript_79077/g.223796 Transcript_79077/m.223796 type:complete len:188 (-) Transcript_79077:109-672(-)
MTVADGSLPFGRLTGVENHIATRCQTKTTLHVADAVAQDRTARPKSAGAARGSWRVVSSVSKPFEQLETVPQDRAHLSWGPKSNAYREKIQRLLDDDLEARKQDNAKARDGHLRRQAMEELLRAPKMVRPRSAGRFFSDPVLLETSESAVRWYMTQSDGVGHAAGRRSASRVRMSSSDRTSSLKRQA